MTAKNRTPKKTTRVLIVDDSAVVRQTLSTILGADPEIDVAATAPDPFVAAARIEAEVPDVITLDIEMPRMDGLTFLEKIMSQHPIAVVICSSLTESGSTAALRAMELGAVDLITKPRVDTRRFLEESRIRICDVVKAASSSRLRPYVPRPAVQPKLTADVVLPKPVHTRLETTEKTVAIGASTGGAEALRDLLEALPADCPGIVIVQHMPEHFTRSFAARLDSLCRISVKEAETNDAVLAGRALSAPGNRHMLLKRSGAERSALLRRGQRRPSGVPAPSVGGRVVPLGGAPRGQERDGHPPHRDG